MNQTHLKLSPRMKTRNKLKYLVIAEWSTENLYHNMCHSIQIMWME